jgi:hypothetical protein
LLFEKIKMKVCRPVILPVVLYGYEACLRVFENRVLRKVFGPKRNEVTR